MHRQAARIHWCGCPSVRRGKTLSGSSGFCHSSARSLRCVHDSSVLPPGHGHGLAARSNVMTCSSTPSSGTKSSSGGAGSLTRGARFLGGAACSTDGGVSTLTHQTRPMRQRRATAMIGKLMVCVKILHRSLLISMSHGTCRGIMSWLCIHTATQTVCLLTSAWYPHICCSLTRTRSVIPSPSIVSRRSRQPILRVPASLRTCPVIQRLQSPSSSVLWCNKHFL